MTNKAKPSFAILTLVLLSIRHAAILTCLLILYLEHGSQIDHILGLDILQFAIEGAGCSVKIRVYVIIPEHTKVI